MVDEAVAVLRLAQIPLEEPLTAAELTDVEARFGFTFAPDHAALLRTCLPVGDSWPDWRNDTDSSLQDWFDSPVEGVLFDVSTNFFWPASWGARPHDSSEALDIARSRLRQWPQMVPLYGHRFMAAGPRGGPVFSIHQSDVIYYGTDLAHYLRQEFLGPRWPIVFHDPDPIWPWADLAGGAENDEL